MRLSDSNLKSYIAQNYPGATYVCAKTYFHRPYLLQRNYGGLNDCTLTSITYCIYKKYKNKMVNDIYNRVEAAAKKFFYNEKIGTIPFFINKIIGEAYNINSTGKMVKNVGFNAKKIVDVVEKQPVILSMFSDGNNYYKNHTVTVVGYQKYRYNGRDIYFLEVRDNWNTTASYVDYQKMSCVSSINYLGL